MKAKAKPTRQVPTALAVGLSLAAGGLQVLNQVVFGLSPQWHAYVEVLLVFAAGFGVSPLVGEQFRVELFALFHVPPATAGMITGGASALSVALTSLSGLPPAGHAALVAAITIAVGLGFAPVSTALLRAATVPAPKA